ncbi:hypothetical protein JMA_42460 (plasmid) [Jeotgalibacillus malaysiensis]|uniref:Uncharacterized protein n=1 Tax=Jeotgalibacillus malaysiensis TaxID=1508404 RepID=A0A0B5AYH5_9BACL|nr:hypothetical protein [Jeotgalibacillus malaysiensis]AJD93563.1 hypothetical protein JMA_42460 [Jeotgalibacillus malaysiensis]
MKKLPVLKQHTPIHPWRNISEHVGIGDIVYITKPIQGNVFRFQLTKKDFIVEWDVKPENYKEIERKCLINLESDEWSNKFIGYAYYGEQDVVLFSIYDLTFHVYLDGETVQQIAEEFGFEKHPILYHGSVKPEPQESVSEFLMNVINQKQKRHREDSLEEQVIIENISRVYQYRRIIGQWSFQNKKEDEKKEQNKVYVGNLF